MNSIATTKGGTHVDYITNQITTYLMNFVNKKNKNANIKAHNVKNHLWVFVNALIDNPAFDSQTKETLTVRQTSFGTKCELSQDFLKNGSFHLIIHYLYTSMLPLKCWRVILMNDLFCSHKVWNYRKSPIMGKLQAEQRS